MTPLERRLDSRRLVAGETLNPGAVRRAFNAYGEGRVVTYLVGKARHSNAPFGQGLHKEIVEVVRQRRQFAPDFSGLFRHYHEAEDENATRTLIAWLLALEMSGERDRETGAERVVDGLKPYLASRDAKVTMHASDLIRRCMAMIDLERPDFGGAGGPVTRARPPVAVIEDFAVAAADGGEVATGSEGDRTVAEAGSVRAARWIIARIVLPADPDRALAGLKANALNSVEVEVATPRDGWLAAVGTSANESIDATLEQGRVHQLKVLFEAPSLELVQAQPIELPAAGPSSRAVFAFQAPKPGTPIEARVTLLHNDRPLQSASLRAFAFADPATVPEGFQASLTLGVVRPGTEGLDQREPADVTIVAGRVGNDAHAAAVSGDALVRFDRDRLDASANEIRSLLRDLSDNPADYAGVEAPRSVELLRNLAHHGRELFREVGEPLIESRPGHLFERIVVLVTDHDTFIPLEFVYDLPIPSRTAGLCRNWEAALRDGRCDEAHHPQGERPGQVTVVCPIGFWALRKVIERQILDFEDDEELKGHDFAIHSEPSAAMEFLDDFTGALFAWSGRVNDGVPGQSDAVLAALNEVTNGMAQPAANWVEWTSAVSQRRPPLLVLLSHTIVEGGIQALEIGPNNAPERLRRSELERGYVRGTRELGPVVLLLGCDTASDQKKGRSFVSAFKREGAALVVGTVAPVLGRNAGPVAAGLVRELRAAMSESSTQAPVSFGQAMRRVRRKLLAEGQLTSLCLTSFGDIDWRLAPRG
jgi:hypothetical protein